jgi:hypothetical protein
MALAFRAVYIADAVQGGRLTLVNGRLIGEH